MTTISQPINLLKPKIFAVVKYIVLIAFAVTTLYPFVWVGLSSLKTDNEVFGNAFGLPSKWMFSNYVDAFTGAQVGQSLFNSLIYSSLSMVLVLLAASMASYVLARVRPNKWLHLFFTLGIMVPIHSVIIPLLIFIRSLDMINTRQGIILAYVVSNLSFSIYILVSFMRTLPREIEDAAAIDGCGRARTFFSIILPMIKPGLATVGTFAFINSWNDLLLALVITVSPHLQTLNLASYNLRARYVQHYALICAGLMLLIIPVTLIYVLLQEQIVRGITAGALKG
jgi:raffinose/stachyose/melibiose transport system permease protein